LDNRAIDIANALFNHEESRHFSFDTEVIAAPETWLDRQPSEFFYEWLAKVRVWSL